MHRLAVIFNGGFSAIDLLIVFSVTSICVVFGAPMLSDYSVRARVTEAFIVAENTRKDVTVACAEDPAEATLDINHAGITFHQSRYVKSLLLQGSCAKPTITVLTQDTGASFDLTLLLSGKSVAGESRTAWTCSSNGPDSYVPESCRK